ncbi:MAG: ImmA/IrrE family metallo-endopeptidase [Corynebacterium sp.]|nr:ImmA/IrrE family metallo-endopeptidase [Corynebacterium sp.]
MLDITGLINRIEQDGYQVTWHTDHPAGAWNPEQNLISIQHGMSDAATRSVLAHEYGHAYHRHPAGCHPAHEDKADRFAARLLISAPEYALAEAIYDSQPALVAAELGVSLRILQAFRRLQVQ